MKAHVAALLVSAGLFYAANAFAQAASVTWPLDNTAQMAATGAGSVVGSTQTISPGPTPTVSVFDYSADGQRVWAGFTGWIAGAEEPTRYLQFDETAAAGSILTVTSVSFNYGAAGISGHLVSNAYYSTDGWTTRTQLNSTLLAYPNAAMLPFTQTVNVPVAAGSTFSVRIYPYAIQNSVAISPTFAVHNSVVITGRTTPRSACDYLCNSDFDDVHLVNPVGQGFFSQDTVSCWKTTEADHLIEVWGSGFGGISAYSGNQFAELNAHQTGTLYQTFSAVAGNVVTISFAHRGRYVNPDVMTVSIGPDSFGAFATLGTYSDNNSAWGHYSVTYTLPITGSMELRFNSISSNGGAGPADGGNFLDAINVSCPSQICGTKFNDVNGDGVRQANETGLANWQISLTGATTAQTTTDNQGAYCFSALGPGTYTVAEADHVGWHQTAPLTPGTYTVALKAGQNLDSFDFGNQPEPSCDYLCNSDFEDVHLVNAGSQGFFAQDTVSCWKTTEADHLIEVWGSGFGGISAYSGNQFAELNAHQTGTLYQTFNAVAGNTVTISFAHRGRYVNPDVMTVSIGPDSFGAFATLGTYSDNNSAWGHYSVTYTLPITGSMELRFNSISSNGGAGPADGGNFLDAINVSCPSQICGTKFNDVNGDGVRQANETGLANWQISLSGTTNALATTDDQGNYCFNALGPGTYTVGETGHLGWHQTAPLTPGTYTVALKSGQNLDSFDFANQRDAPAGCVDPPSGLVGWWPGDDHANDLSAFHNGGILMGGATYGGGKVADAFTLMNAADYVSIPDADSLNFGTSDFSIDAWVKSTDRTNVLNIVDKRTGTVANPVGYSLFISGGKLGFQMGDGQATLNHLSTAPTISDGNWHLVAVAVDRNVATGGMLYVDGAPVQGFDPTSRSGSVTNTAPLYLGQRHLSAPTTFSGQIDEVELYSRALSDAEVSSLAAADSSGKCRGPCDETPQELPLNTGFDHTTASVYPVGGNDAFWTITLDADTSRTVPRPAEVIAHVTPVWPPAQNGSQWIGPSQVVPNNSSLGAEQNDVGLGNYRYELALCIVGGTADQLTFNLVLLADNNATVSLRRPNGTSLAVGATSSNGFSSPTSIVTTLTGSFVAGTYALEVDVHNDGISPDFTGINLTGTISGANLYLQKHECCSSSGKLTGTKFSDANGNGVNDNEAGLQGVIIQLLQNGTSVAQDTTDGAGEYFFDVAPGTYTVREVVPAGYTQTSPAAGTYTVTVGPGGIVPNLDFGNHAIPCLGASSQFLCKPLGGRYIQLTLIYSGTVPVSHITVTSLTPGVSFTVTNTPTYPVSQGGTVVLNIDFSGLAPGAAAQMLITMDGPEDPFGVSASCCDGTLPVVRPGGPGSPLSKYCGPVVIYGEVAVTGNPRVPADKWVIRLEDQVGSVSTTETDTTGYFVQEGLPVGTYKISVDSRLGWKVGQPASGFFLLPLDERGLGSSLKFVISPVATVSSLIASDFNGDGTVDLADFFLFADAFGGTDARFDLDKNGVVDLGDFFIFADNFAGAARAKLMALAQQHIGLPASPRLEPNFPNPFNSSTTIKYYIIEPDGVHLDVFDLGGQKVKSIVNDYQLPGAYAVTWDGTNEQGQPVSTGVYLTRLEAGGITEMKKMLLMK